MLPSGNKKFGKRRRERARRVWQQSRVWQHTKNLFRFSSRKTSEAPQNGSVTPSGLLQGLQKGLGTPLGLLQGLQKDLGAPSGLLRGFRRALGQPKGRAKATVSLNGLDDL